MGRNRKFVLEDDLQQAVWHNIARSKAAICEVVQVIARKFEAGSSQTGPVWSVFDDTPSFPFSRRSDGGRTQSK